MMLPRALLFAALCACPIVVSAGPAADAAGTCLTDNTTGKDRKILTRWIFLAMTRHPDLAALSAATDADHDAGTRQMAALFERLITQDCRSEIRAMVAAEGSSSMRTPFEVLGRVAMVELMGNPTVAAQVGRLDQFVDQQKIAEIMQGD
jgi:hypothetical protein